MLQYLFCSLVILNKYFKTGIVIVQMHFPSLTLCNESFGWLFEKVKKHKGISGGHIERLPFGLIWYYYVGIATRTFTIHKNVYFVAWGKFVTCLNSKRKTRQKSVAAILKKWSPFCFDWHCHARIYITWFLINDSTYLATNNSKQWEADISGRWKWLAAILKNGHHFVYKTNLRWPYF